MDVTLVLRLCHTVVTEIQIQTHNSGLSQILYMIHFYKLHVKASYHKSTISASLSFNSLNLLFSFCTFGMPNFTKGRGYDLNYKQNTVP